MIKQASQSSIRVPKTLAGETVTKLTDRLKDEYTAHFFYRNATNWCANEGYVKAAAFFAEEAEAELDHAKGIQKYLVDWNLYPTMPAVKPTIQFANLIDIINKAYALEYSLFDAYTKDSADLFATDLNTFDFLTGYRTIQTQSVIEYSDLLNAANLINVENNFEVLYFEGKYF